MKCQFPNCNKELKNLNSLSKHIKIHKISNRQYYDMFMKLDGEGKCLECGNDTTYMDLRQGYRKYCHNPCPSPTELSKVLEYSVNKKYGVFNCSKLDFVKKKKEDSSTKKFGVKYVFQSDYFKESVKNKLLVEHGVDHISKVDSVKKKTKNTFLSNYGVDHPMKVDRIKNKCFNTYYKNYFKKLLKYLDERRLELLSEYKSGVSGKETILKFKCIICKTEFESTWWNVYQGCSRCPKCFPKIDNTSYAQYEIYKYLLDFSDELGEIVLNDKNTIKPKHLDIFIPSKKIGIEYCGLHWHSDKFQTSNNSHIDKLNLCNSEGINLIYIFEDEWLNKRNIVIDRLEHILNISKKKTIYARKCTIKEIDSKTKNEFLNEFHLQGKDYSVIKLGAFYNNELVSVMTFSHGNISKGSKNIEDVWELNRFCTKCNIPGIASKLLFHFKNNYAWKEIFSYADRRWSNGDLYYKLGFELSHITSPNYWYIKGYHRIHRFNLRKTEKDNKNISEHILRENEGYERIWDCGNYKFVLKFK